VREEIERPAAGARTRRSPIDHFVEATYQQVSRPPFFLICVAIIVGWLVSLPLWGDTKAGQVVIHTIASVLHAAAGRTAGERRVPQRRGRVGKAQRHRRGARRADGLARHRGPQSRGSGDPIARRGRPRRAPLNQTSGQPGRKLSRTFRSGLSAFVSPVMLAWHQWAGLEDTSPPTCCSHHFVAFGCI
jgi:hypothetical protein